MFAADDPNRGREKAKAVNGIRWAKAVRYSPNKKTGFVFENDHQFPILLHLPSQTLEYVPVS